MTVGFQNRLTEGDLVVPAQNSADNADMIDVVGNKTDTYGGDSLYALCHQLYEHIQSRVRVYPTLAAGATVVSGAANWTLGAFATIVPASTITELFHIHFVSIESLDKNAIFELVLYQGDSDIEIARKRFTAVGGFWGNAEYRIDSKYVAGNSRIRAKLASSDGLANQATMTVTIGYTIEA